MWGWVTWAVAILAVWVVVALLVGVLIGRAVRHRDLQVPTDAVPAPRPGPDSLPALLSRPPEGTP